MFGLGFDVTEMVIKLFVSHAVVTGPVALAAGYIGWKAPRLPDVFLLMGLGMLLYTAMPMVPGTPTGADGMMYLGLAYFVPWYILVPYTAGVFLNQLLLLLKRVI